jgi:hypothetical protein
MVQERLREGAPGRAAGAEGRAHAGAFDHRFGGLTRAAVVDDLQFGVHQFQRRPEVVVVAVGEVRRFNEAFFFQILLELGLVVAVGERIAEGEIGAPDPGGAGGQSKHDRSECGKSSSAHQQARANAI